MLRWEGGRCWHRVLTAVVDVCFHPADAVAGAANEALSAAATAAQKTPRALARSIWSPPPLGPSSPSSHLTRNSTSSEIENCFERTAWYVVNVVSCLSVILALAALGCCAV